MNKIRIESRAIAKYGLTDDPCLASWMTMDGKLINGSLEGNQRDLDHREIQEFYPGLDPEDAIKKFMRRKNIRMGFSETGPCFEFLVPLSESQIAYLVPWAHWAMKNKKDFCSIRHVGPKRVCENALQFLFYISKYMRRNVFEYSQDPFKD